LKLVTRKPRCHIPFTQYVAFSYRAFHRFVQAKFPDGGLILGSIQFSILPQLPPKILLDSKGVKIDPIVIMLFDPIGGSSNLIEPKICFSEKNEKPITIKIIFNPTKSNQEKDLSVVICKAN